MRYYNRLVMDQVSNSRRYIQTAKSQFVRVEKDIVLRWSEETESALFSLKPVLEFLRDLPIVSPNRLFRCPIAEVLNTCCVSELEYTGRAGVAAAISACPYTCIRRIRTVPKTCIEEFIGVKVNNIIAFVL
jgi:hypothetical protein